MKTNHILIPGGIRDWKKWYSSNIEGKILEVVDDKWNLPLFRANLKKGSKVKCLSVNNWDATRFRPQQPVFQCVDTGSIYTMDLEMVNLFLHGEQFKIR